MGLKRLVLVLIVCSLIYAPSLNHLPRSDQLVYFASVAQFDELKELTWDYSFNYRENSWIQNSGDMLFRPLLYWILGLEKWLFGYHFWAWQLFGITMHLLVVGLLFRLLNQIQPGKYALLFTTFFATLYAGMEMVIWQHINAYLVFIAVSCVILQQFWEIMQDPSTAKKRVWPLMIWLWLACFLYELGLFLVILAAAYFWFCCPERSLRKKTAVIIAIPGAVYLSAGAFIFLKYAHTWIPSGEIQWSLGKTVSNTAGTLTWWLYSGFFPMDLKFTVYQRTGFLPGIFEHQQLAKSMSNGLPWFLGAGLLFVWILVTLRTAFRSVWGHRRHFILFIIGILSAFVLMLVLGRINAKGLEYYLENNSYNNYFFWFYFLILLYSLINFEELEKKSQNAVLRNIWILLFYSMTAINGIQVFRLNQAKERFDQKMLTAFLQVDHFVHRHQSDPDFTFGFHPSSKAWNEVVPFRKAADPENRQYTFFEMLYPQYYRSLNPKYLLVKQGDHLYWSR